ncbi:MAG: acyltransferase family protein, partial [Pseudomonadota bacterium]
VAGGFIGVDVFFVISGFLITRILVELPGTATEKLITFAARRVRRLLPSALFLVLVMGVLITQLLFWFDVERFFEEAVAFAGFHSNNHFYDEAGYFDAGAHEKLLLHTWSLSIEWQFYAIWALIVVLALSVGAKTHHVRILAGLSLVLSLFWSIVTVAGDRDAAFFLVESRFWEFQAGSLIALIRVPRFGKQTAALGAIAGLGLIVAPALIYDQQTAFPGMAALPVVVGTACLILFGHQETAVQRVLSAKPIVLLGQISYSLYLWHWPLLILTELYHGRAATVPERIVLFVVSVGLAFLLWHGLEQPFRRRWRWRDRSIVGSGVFGCLLLVGLFLGVKELQGWPLHRQSPLVERLVTQSRAFNPLVDECLSTESRPTLTPEACLFGKAGAESSQDADFIVFGDSHGDHWVPGLAKLGQGAGKTGLQLTGSSCIPLRGVTTVRWDQPYQPCQLFRENAFEFIDRLDGPKTVVLAARWSIYFETTQFHRNSRLASFFTVSEDEPSLDVATSQRVIESQLIETMDWLTDRGHRVILLGQAPEFGLPQKRCVIRRLLSERDGSDCGPPLSALLRRLAPVHAVLARVADRDPSVELVLPEDWLCNDSGCLQAIDGDMLYRDGDHFNVTGSEHVVALFADALDL